VLFFGNWSKLLAESLKFASCGLSATKVFFYIMWSINTDICHYPGLCYSSCAQCSAIDGLLSGLQYGSEKHRKCDRWNHMIFKSKILICCAAFPHCFPVASRRLNFLFHYVLCVHCLERPSLKWPIVLLVLKKPVHHCTVAICYALPYCIVLYISPVIMCFMIAFYSAKHFTVLLCMSCKL